MSHVLILGAGLSGEAAAAFLRKRDRKVVVSDPKLKDERLADRFLSIKADVHFTEQNSDLLLDAELLVVSPGIPPSHKLVSEAKKRNISIITEVELGLRDFKGRVIGVTGTNGKSTAVSMATHMLNCLGLDAAACGNIGVPVCQVVDEDDPDWLVVELSSYQLEYAHNLGLDGALFTSLSPDHLSRHGTMSAYALTKWKIASFCQSDGIISMPQFVLAYLEGIPEFHRGDHTIQVVDNDDVNKQPVPVEILSHHDRSNAMLAGSVISHCTEKSLDLCLSTLKSFRGLDHRYQVFGHVAGYPLINDSKATNMEAVQSALQSVTAPCYLLLGGESKGESFHPIEAFSDKIHEVWAFGSAADEVVADLGPVFQVKKFDSLKMATLELKAHLDKEPRCVLLSPGCASFDEFDNFEDRGFRFMQWLAK